MTIRYKPSRSRKVRNLRSVGWEGAKFAARAAEKSAEGLFRWATTDHSGMNRALIKMPSMGFIGTIKYMLTCLCCTVAHAIAMAVAVFLTVAYWIPFLLSVLIG